MSLESKKAAQTARLEISLFSTKDLSSGTKSMVNLDNLKEEKIWFECLFNL